MEQRQWVTQASEEAAEYMRAEAAEMENAKIQELQDAGMTVIELTEEERQTFVDAVDGVAEQFRDEMGEEAWELYQTCITDRNPRIAVLRLIWTGCPYQTQMMRV